VITKFWPKKNIEIGGMERAVVHEPHHLQDSKQIPFAFFDLGALIPMAAVFDVQWMQMVSLRKLVQFRARGVGDLIPRHTLRIALLVKKRDHRIDSCGMRHRIKASTVIKAGPKPTALHCRNLRLLDWAHTRVPSDHGAALVRRMFVDKDRVQRIWQREGLKVSCQTERARNQVCAPHPPRCAPDIYGANMSRVHYRRAAL
jgi:hypothetical protein